jgi:hypothetical protein
LNENGWDGAGAISEAKREDVRASCSVNVKNASSRTNERDAEGVAGMEMEMEKNYT